MTADTGAQRFVPVAGEADVAPGAVTVVGAEGRSFCLARTEAGAWGAIDNVCTHDGAALGEGVIEDSCVECPRHGARFDIFTGEVKALPAVFPVNAYPVRIRDGIVELDLGVTTKELELG